MGGSGEEAGTGWPVRRSVWCCDSANSLARSPDHTDQESLRDPRLFSYSGNTGEKPHWAFQISVH